MQKKVQDILDTVKPLGNYLLLVAVGRQPAAAQLLGEQRQRRLAGERLVEQRQLELLVELRRLVLQQPAS